MAVRGGNSEAGELVGRCANAMALAPASRRPDLGVRCCAGDVNRAEVTPRGHPQERRSSRATTIGAADRARRAVRDKAPAELPAIKPFRIDRVWLWHPVGNEELLVARRLLEDVRSPRRAASACFDARKHR